MRVLHAIHDFLPRHRAGSEIYAHELCLELARAGHEVHVLCADYDPGRVHGTLVWRWFDGVPVTELVNNWAFSSFSETYNSPRVNRQLEHVVRAVQPDVLHVHNLLGLSFDLPAIAGRHGIPSAATVHEYALVCPSGGQRLHLADEHVCHHIDPERCARCFGESPFYQQMAFAAIARPGVAQRVARRLTPHARRFPRLVSALGRQITARSSHHSPTPEAIRERLRAAAEVFETIDLFVSPSSSLGAELLRFGLPASKLEVSDNGFVVLEPAAKAPSDGRLRIGFVGTLVWHKGAHVLVEAARRLPPDRCRVTLFGDLDTFPNYVSDLQSAATGLPVCLAGGFRRADAASVYAQIDVLVVPSLWLENSPLVIHEAWMAGVPVVGARMGGIVDLIEDGRGGLLYDAFSADDLAAKLRRLLDEPDLLDRFRSNLPPVKSITDDARDWGERYERVLARHREPGSIAAPSHPRSEIRNPKSTGTP